MNLQELDNRMVFRKDNEYGTFYTIGMSKKLEDGSYENGYMDVRFKKDVDLENMTKINIKEAWLTFYTKSEGDDKVTKPYIFINRFELVEDSDIESNSDEIVINPDDLPF